LRTKFSSQSIILQDDDIKILFTNRGLFKEQPDKFQRMNQESAKSPLLHLICGLPGSGKTRLAKSLQASTGAIRLCPDEWIKDIWGEKSETEGNLFRDQIEQLQWKIGKEILKNSINLIIEWGTWGRAEREKLRDEAWEMGAKVKFYFLDVPREILKERILKRNQEHTFYEFHITETDIDAFLDDCFKSIQIPSSEELSQYDFLWDGSGF
jgi:predicted kinase